MADLVSEKHFVKNPDLVSVSCQLPTIATYILLTIINSVSTYYHIRISSNCCLMCKSNNCVEEKYVIKNVSMYVRS